VDLTNWPIWANLILFAASGVAVWIAGTRMAGYTVVIGDRIGMGQAFAGMLLLGAATSLPEVATISTSAWYGDAGLAVNSILGSVAMNVLLLALADAVLGRDALTSTVAAPSTLLQGTWGILLLAVAVIGVAAGDYAVFGVGLCSAALLPGFVIALMFASGYAARAPWQVIGMSPEGQNQGGSAETRSDAADEALSTVVTKAAIAATVLLTGGFFLSRAGDAIAQQTGLGTSIVGFVLVGLSTSLPEISSVVAAIRQKHYELAIGDIFGTNLFNLALIPLADIIYRQGPILREGGPFELVAGLLGIVLTAVFIVGLLERRDRTILRMGYDSLAAIVFYAIGLAMLYSVSGG
jgi:cation:H+ antiporter